MSQNVLITGITGMVGQHFAASFRKDGYQVWGNRQIFRIQQE